MIVRVVREGPVLPVVGKADRLSLPGVFDGFQLRLRKGGEGNASLFGLPFGLLRPAVRSGQQGQRGPGQCDEAQQDQQGAALMASTPLSSAAADGHHRPHGQ